MFNYPDPTEEYEEVKEPTLSELFHEYEDMPDEAINYVAKLEKERRDTIEELKVLRDTAKAGGRLDFYVKKINGLIRKLM